MGSYLNKIKKRVDSRKKIEPPMYQQLGYEPPTGGKSYLHDDNGVPLIPNEKKTKITTSYIKKEHNQKFPDVFIKQPAFKQGKVQISKTLNVPKPTFVNVGSSHDQLWFGELVTGAPMQKSPQPTIIDNNDVVDIESLQGRNFTNQKIEELKDHPLIEEANGVFNNLSTYLNQKIVNEDLFKKFDAFLSSPKSPIDHLLNKVSRLPKNQREYVGEMIDSMVGQFAMELSSKQNQFTKTEETDADYPTPDYGEGMSADDSKEEEEQQYYQTIPKIKTEKALKDLSENIINSDVGSYSIFIDGFLLYSNLSLDKLKLGVESLLIQKKVPLDRITVLQKSKPILSITLALSKGL